MIYVHVPFCRSFCTYCDFYSEICSRNVSQQVQNRVFEDYVEGVVDEVSCRLRSEGVVPDDVRCADPSHCKQWAPPSYDAEGGTITGTTPSSLTPPHSSDGLPLQDTEDGTSTGITPSSLTPPETLYFGGGTPSVLPLEAIARIVEALGPREYEEFTVEVNPDDITEKGVEYVRGLVGLGVNRISMGVQSFDDRILRWMNRRHDAQGARSAVDIIREAGVQNLSIDLIFGLAQLSEEEWRGSIEEALKLHPEHISAYQLSIEEGSALGKLVREGRYVEASDEQCRRQYDLLCEELRRAGYVHYEISNWALPGREARHNSAYWRRVPYVGLGPGAHSLEFHDGVSVRSWNSETLAQRGPDGSLVRWSAGSETLSASEVSEETVMLALRTAAGIDEGLLRSIAGQETVDELLAEGALVAASDSAIRIPEQHFFISDDIIARLIAHL